MQIHLLDGTFELYRCFYGAPSARTSQGREVGATRTFLRSLASWLQAAAVTHVACAFDHVIESFRNQLFAGYKTGEGIDPLLHAQFELAERAAASLGMTVWPMVDFEADDALATAATKFAADDKVARIVICSPDKDLSQCIRAARIVSWDRLRDSVLDEAGVIAKFGVPPASIPDLLALIGDTADGIPGIARWGKKSAAAVLATYGSIDRIPDDPALWTTSVRGARALAENLARQRSDALLYRQLATLRTDVPLRETVDDIAWPGAKRHLLEQLCDDIEDRSIVGRIKRWAPA